METTETLTAKLLEEKLARVYAEAKLAEVVDTFNEKIKEANADVKYITEKIYGDNGVA